MYFKLELKFVFLRPVRPVYHLSPLCYLSLSLVYFPFSAFVEGAVSIMTVQVSFWSFSVLTIFLIFIICF